MAIGVVPKLVNSRLHSKDSGIKDAFLCTVEKSKVKVVSLKEGSAVCMPNVNTVA